MHSCMAAMAMTGSMGPTAMITSWAWMAPTACMAVPEMTFLMRAQALEIQKQSVEGLLGLMRQLGAGYVELSKYNSESACEILDSVAPHQRNTGWVRGLLGKAKFEVAQYKDAKE